MGSQDKAVSSYDHCLSSALNDSSEDWHDTPYSYKLTPQVRREKR